MAPSSSASAISQKIKPIRISPLKACGAPSRSSSDSRCGQMPCELLTEEEWRANSAYRVGGSHPSPVPRKIMPASSLKAAVLHQVLLSFPSYVIFRVIW